VIVSSAPRERRIGLGLRATARIAASGGSYRRARSVSEGCVREADQHVAVARTRGAPAAEDQAAELWEGRDQLRVVEQPRFVALDALAAGAIAAHHERVAPLRTYLGRAVAGVAAWAFLRAIRPLESCSRARWFSSFLDQRMRIPRLRFSQA
jgi:hypothetical protein